MTAIALSVAGSDPSGGAGIQADLKTFHQRGVYGAAVISLLTVQNSRGVERVEVVGAPLLAAQLRGVIDDLEVGAAKTGALGSRENVQAVVEAVKESGFPWVVDPVFLSSSGVALLDKDAVVEVRDDLIPVATLVTPNIPEAEALCGRAVRSVGAAREAAHELATLGPAVLLKGGHLAEPEDEVVDVFCADGTLEELRSPRLATSVRGTGCALSAAITAELARGVTLAVAVRRARRWLQGALETALDAGKGSQSVNHFWKLADET